MISMFNIEDKKYQMLKALEHPLESPIIFEVKEREECFAPLINSVQEGIEISKFTQSRWTNWNGTIDAGGKPSTKFPPGGVVEHIAPYWNHFFRQVTISLKH